MTDAIVVMKDVEKEYLQGETIVPALRGLDLTIYPGEFTAIAGPSGSGKSTALNLIGALDTPSKGQVLVEGQDLSTLSQAALSELRLRRIGFIFQAYNLIPVLTAYENAEFVMMLQGIPEKERRDTVMNILKEVGLEAMADRRPAQLSGGQQQRVAIARAVAANPALVLADEPTANLDSKTAEALLDLMLEMNEKHNTTFIFSTHDQKVMDRARRLVHLQDGTITEDSLRKAVA